MDSASTSASKRPRLNFPPNPDNAVPTVLQNGISMLHQHDGVYINQVLDLMTKTLNSERNYRVWDPFQCKLASAILAGISDIVIKPGSKVYFFGTDIGNDVAHISDIVGAAGRVYSFELREAKIKELENWCQSNCRTNVLFIQPEFHGIDTMFLHLAVGKLLDDGVLRVVQQYVKLDGYVIITAEVGKGDDFETAYKEKVAKLNPFVNFMEMVELPHYVGNNVLMVFQYKGKDRVTIPQKWRLRDECSFMPYFNYQQKRINFIKVSREKFLQRRLVAGGVNGIPYFDPLTL